MLGHEKTTVGRVGVEQEATVTRELGLSSKRSVLCADVLSCGSLAANVVCGYHVVAMWPLCDLYMWLLGDRHVFAV